MGVGGDSQSQEASEMIGREGCIRSLRRGPAATEAAWRSIGSARRRPGIGTAFPW